MRTARANGERVLSIAERFGIHRATVWEHTKSASDSESRRIAGRSKACVSSTSRGRRGR
jgi:hypothetical protein